MPDAPGLELILAEINRTEPGAVIDTSFDREQASLIVDPRHIITVLTWLKETPGQEYTFLSSVHGVDYLPNEPRFAVIYEMLNRERYERLRVKALLTDPAVTVSAGTTAPSATPVPPASSSDAADGTLTLGTYRDLWANPVTDLSPSLNYLIPAQRLEIATADAKRLGLSRGDVVGVKSGDKEVVARVAVRAAMPEGTCFLMEGTLEGNANVFANGKPAQVEIGKPSVALDLVQAGGES